jgi:signal transduction histidine kinase
VKSRTPANARQRAPKPKAAAPSESETLHEVLGEIRRALAESREELARHIARCESNHERPAVAEREILRKLLHDGIGQTLTSAMFLASGLHQRLATLALPEKEIVEELILLLNQAIAESRNVAAHCEPPSKTQRPST